MSLKFDTLIPHTASLLFQSCSRHPRRSALALCLGLSLGAGCDPQAPTEYQGEQLLSIRGSVETERGVNTEGLQPALAFFSKEREALHVIEVDVHGEFPNRFQLDVYDPPPADSLLSTGASYAEDGEPENIALGYVTAMPADHPEYVPVVGSSTSSSAGEACGDGPCPTRAGDDPAGPVTVESALCTGSGDAQRCYSRTLLCPTLDTPEEECEEISHEGDPSIAELPWSGFAGVSENFVVLYVDQPAPAGSYTGLAFGIREPLSAGYHLFEVRKATEAELAENDACKNDAKQLAADRYNETYGTSETPASLSTCNWQSCDTNKQYEFAQLVEVASHELACSKSEQVFTLVENPVEQPISVRLGRHPEVAFPL